MSESKVPLSTPRTGWRYGFMLVLLAFSAIGTFDMRIRPILSGIPINFDESVAQGQLHHAGTNRTIAIRQHYTGVDAIDQVLQFLVVAFIAGPARFEARIWLQQFHFLSGFAPIIGIMTVESCRARWRSSRTVKFTSLWALLYQTLGGAIIVPLYSLAFVHASRMPDNSTVPARVYLTSGQDIDQASLRSLIPAITLSYVLPTATMYLYQFSDLNITMGLVALWQISPLLVNVLLTSLRYILPRQHAIGTINDASVRRTDVVAITRREYTHHIYALYAVLICFAGLVHLYVLWVIFTSPSALEAFSSVFIPDFGDAAVSTASGLHNIFQWDWILIAVAQLTCSLYTVLELKYVAAVRISLAKALAMMLAWTVVVGPGAAVACVWWWRETWMVQIARELKSS